MSLSFQVIRGAIFCVALQGALVHTEEMAVSTLGTSSSEEKTINHQNREKEEKVLAQWNNVLKRKRLSDHLPKQVTTPPPSLTASPSPISTEVIKKLKEDLKTYEDLRINRQNQNVKLPVEEQTQVLEEFRKHLLGEINEAKQQKIDLSTDSELKNALNRFFSGNSVSEFSGALQAKTLGLTGANVPILVLENDLKSNHTDLAAFEVISPQREANTATGHGAHVIGIIQQIAPDAKYFIHDTSIPAAEILQKAKLVNASFGPPQNDGNIPTFSAILGSNLLLVAAAGNSGIDLDNPFEEMQLFLRELPETLWDGLLLVGNISYGNIPSPFSNRPGAVTRFQENFIWTLGSDVLSHSKNSSYERKTGTSMATPVTTGCLALIAEKHPNFSPLQLKECVLESARQDFYIDVPNWIPGWNLTVHVAPGNKSSIRFVGNNIQAEEPYDSAIWGKGILDLRRALLYADLKSQSKDKEYIKAELQQIEEKTKDPLHHFAFKKIASRDAQSPQVLSPQSLPSASESRSFWNTVFLSAGRSSLIQWIRTTGIKALQKAFMNEIFQQPELLKKMEETQLKETFLIALQLKEYTWIINNVSALTQGYNSLSNGGILDVLKAILLDKDPKTVSCLKAFQEFFNQNPKFLASTILSPHQNYSSSRQDYKIRTFLDLAACVGAPEKIVTLLESKAILDDRDLKMSLNLAKRHNSGAETIRVLEEGWNRPKVPALFEAAAKGPVQQLELLLPNRNVNACNSEKDCLLSIAVQAQNKETMSFLIQKGADLRLLTNADWQAIVSAPGSSELARILFTSIFALDANGTDNHPLLQLAAEKGRVDLIRMFVREFKADINAPLWGGTTLLHTAATCNQIETFTALVKEFHADLTARNKDEKTPLDLLPPASKEIVKEKLNQ